MKSNQEVTVHGYCLSVIRYLLGVEVHGSLTVNNKRDNCQLPPCKKPAGNCVWRFGSKHKEVKN